jgi:hypothetical protein
MELPMILSAPLNISFRKSRLWQVYTDVFVSRPFAAPLSEKLMIASIDNAFPLNMASHTRDNAEDQPRVAVESQSQAGVKQDVSEGVTSSLAVTASEILSTKSKLFVETMGVSIALEVEEKPNSRITISGQFIVTDEKLSSWYDAIVQFWQDGRLKRFTVVNNSGMFTCKADHFHNIRLVAINRDGQVVMFNDIDFSEQNLNNE